MNVAPGGPQIRR